ncbi:MAG TPA: hypothetical protein VKG25_19640 [Bryobacteraceae bacterium]|nr:hypothetical protein [Bryobacteraceae bacterium]
MLNDFQQKNVWEGMLNAETRSLYFGDLASRYTRRKQWITGASFFLSSGAAATIIGKAPIYVPIVLSIASALATAYSIAVSLDRKIVTMAKLHSAWSQIATDYSRLWNHMDDQDAEAQLEKLFASERSPSELATTEAPNNQKLLGQWQDRVFSMYGIEKAA